MPDDPSLSSICLPDTGDLPSLSSRLWPTPCKMDGDITQTLAQWEKRRDRHAAKGVNLHRQLWVAMQQEMEARPLSFTPSDSLRSNPMPAPSSLNAFPTFPISGAWSMSPAQQSLRAVVRSRLSLLGASPASRTPPLASDSPAPTNAISGANVSESLAIFDPALRCSRTSADCSPVLTAATGRPAMRSLNLDFFSIALLQIWPRSGMVSHGKLSALPIWKPPTSESASGCSVSISEAWRTPMAADAKNMSCASQVYLSDQATGRAKQWPTAKAQDGKHGSPTAWELTTEHEGTKESLRVKVAQEQAKWPTPMRHDDHPQGINSTQQGLAATVQNTCGLGPLLGEGGPLDSASDSSTGNRQGWWPTPLSSDGEGSPSGTLRNSPSLPTTVIQGEMGNWLGGGMSRAERQRERKLRQAGMLETPIPPPRSLGWLLNPDWVEILMGLPMGWTQLPRKFSAPKRSR